LIVPEKSVVLFWSKSVVVCRKSNERLRHAVHENTAEMGRDEDEIREQEAGGAAFWAVVVVIGVALVVAGGLGYVDVSLDLFSVSITPELTGATLVVIGLLMVAVFVFGGEKGEE